MYFCFVNGIVFQKEHKVEGEKLTIRSMYFSLKNVIVSVKIIRFFVKWMTGKDNEYILSACTQMYRISINSTRASLIKAAAIILLARAAASNLRYIVHKDTLQRVTSAMICKKKLKYFSFATLIFLSQLNYWSLTGWTLQQKINK